MSLLEMRGITKRFPGVLANHSVSRDEAEQMVMASRLKAGWITEADIAAGQEEEAVEEAVEETAGA